MKNVTNFHSEANRLAPRALVIRSTNKSAWAGVSLHMESSLLIHSFAFLNRSYAETPPALATLKPAPPESRLPVPVEKPERLLLNLRMMSVDRNREREREWWNQWSNNDHRLERVTTDARLESPPILNNRWSREWTWKDVSGSPPWNTTIFDEKSNNRNGFCTIGCLNKIHGHSPSSISVHYSQLNCHRSQRYVGYRLVVKHELQSTERISSLGEQCAKDKWHRTWCGDRGRWSQCRTGELHASIGESQRTLDERECSLNLTWKDESYQDSHAFNRCVFPKGGTGDETYSPDFLLTRRDDRDAYRKLRQGSERTITCLLLRRDECEKAKRNSRSLNTHLLYKPRKDVSAIADVLSSHRHPYSLSVGVSREKTGDCWFIVF